MVVHDPGHRVDDVGEPDPPVEEGLDALLVGRVVDRRVGPAGLSDPLGEADGRERLVVEREELPGGGPRPVAPGARPPAPAPATPGPSAMGSFMSGGEAWARVDPSTNSTIEWTTDCGWTTTWIRSNGTSKSRWASMTSRPLLTSVAEFVVMTGPMAHVGWASACSRRDVVQLVAPHPPERSPARGDHEPLDLVGRPAAQALGQGRVLTVHGDDLAGLGGGLDQRPADDERLLVGQRERRPGVERGERRRAGRSSR